MISPMIFYLVITGFIGAFKAYSDAVAIFRLATVPFNLLKSSGLFGPEVLFS